MVEVFERLFVGDEHAYERQVAGQSGWRVVHACKDPYHRRLLGYTTPGAPKDHPEYMMAIRPLRLYLNIVDAPSAQFFHCEVFDQVLGFMKESLESGDRVLVHCNQGESRGPSIALLYLAVKTDALPNSTHAEAEAAFRSIYTSYNPKKGIRDFLIQNWERYLLSR